MRCLICFVFRLGLVLALFATHAFAQESGRASTDGGLLVLKLNHTDTPSGVRHEAADLFAKRLAQLSNGRIRLLVFHSGQLGNDPQSVNLVGEGMLDFTVSATGSYASLVPQLNLTALPFLVHSYEEGWRFYDGSSWLKQHFDKLPPKGLRHLATWEAGFRSFTTRTPLLRPSDAAGKKIRVFPNEMIQWIMQAIGYDPVLIPVGETYAAIQQGQVDGQENPINTIRALRFYEVAPNISLTQHVYSPLPLVVSEQTWRSLSAADQLIVRKAALAAQSFSRTRVRGQDDQALQAMQAAGAKIVKPDLAAFRAAMTPVLEKARAKYGKEVDAILQEDARSERM
jgi:TRAP-type transport system periplasmic protein